MSASPPLSKKEPSIQSRSRSNNHHSYNRNSYITQEITHDDDDISTKNLKYSLASYFSTIFVVFIGLLLISTIVLFIWSNTSDGAWVSLQVKPVIPDDDEWSFPIKFSFASLNNKLSISSPSSRSNRLSSMLLKNKDNLNIFNHYYSMNEMNELNETISDLSINMNIFHFSLVDSVSDFWQSKAYSLAILIAMFSGIWPYIKLLLLCYCWIIPMKQINREGILIFLDQMGKFSFIDLFVSLYMIVSFYVDITEQLPHNGVGFNLKVVVEPDVGLNTFVIGTVISMIFSHLLLYLDAKYAKPHIKKVIALQQTDYIDDDDYNKEQQQIKNIKNKHEWNISFKPFFIKYLPFSYFGILMRSIMLLLIWITLYMIIDTVFIAPVRYNITGLVGFFVSNPQRSYSAWQIVTEVPSHTDEHIAAPPLSACLFFTIIFFPILLLLLIVFIWHLPLKHKYLNYLNILMQVSMAWSALDVFAVASIAASLELSRVSQWILNDSYAKVCGTNPPGIIPTILTHLTGRDSGCFSVDGYLVSPGIYIVVIGAIFAWILFIYTIYQLYKSNKYLKSEINKSLPDKTIFFFNH